MLILENSGDILSSVANSMFFVRDTFSSLGLWKNDKGMLGTGEDVCTHSIKNPEDVNPNIGMFKF